MEIQCWFLSVEKRKSISLTRFAFEDEHVGYTAAREARVELAQTNGHLTISVRDDGKGIPKRLTEFKPGSIGVGIGGMRQRVSELGGKLKLENTNPGTLVQVVIPNTSAEMGEQVASEISTEASGNRPCGVNKSVQN